MAENQELSWYQLFHHCWHRRLWQPTLPQICQFFVVTDHGTTGCRHDILRCRQWRHLAVPVEAFNLEPPDPRTRKQNITIRTNIWPHIRTHINIFSCAALFQSGTHSLPAPSRLHLLSPSRLIWQAVLRGTSRDQAHPSAIHSRGGLRIILLDQTRQNSHYDNSWF